MFVQRVSFKYQLIIWIKYTLFVVFKKSLALFTPFILNSLLIKTDPKKTFTFSVVDQII